MALWIDGIGGQFDPYAVKNNLKSALYFLELRANRILEEFDFTQFTKKIKGTWYRKEKVIPLFSEKMPVIISDAVKIQYDVNREIEQSCLLPSGDSCDYLFYQHPWDEAAEKFQKVVNEFSRVRKIKSVIQGLANTIDQGLKYVTFTDEAFKYYSSVIDFCNNEIEKKKENSRIFMNAEDKND